MLELVDRGRGVTDKILDRVLVAEPVRPLDGVVHVKAPVVLAHIAERRRDAALRRDRMAAGREDLGDAGRLEAALARAERSPEARTAGADDDHVEGVVDKGIGAAVCGRRAAIGFRHVSLRS